MSSILTKVIFIECFSKHSFSANGQIKSIFFTNKTIKLHRTFALKLCFIKITGLGRKEDELTEEQKEQRIT